MPSKTPAQASSRVLWRLLAGVMLVCVTLTVWSFQKWDRVWIEQSGNFFPPEYQTTDETETLAWQYPIYRSNDTYQWVHLADSLAGGDASVLRHRADEGPPEGRANIWHSGLAHLLHWGGSLHAAASDWPAERGIHALAHWLGSILHLGAILLGTVLIYRLRSPGAAALFALCYFFHAAIAWDFAFSRLDHEAVFHVFFLLQVLGLFGLLHAKNASLRSWALVAGIGTAGCWWVSATVQSAIGVLTVLGCLAAYFPRAKKTEIETDGSDQTRRSRAFLEWGGCAALGILLFCLLERRSPTAASIATLHPIFALAQLGAAAVCAASVSPAGRQRNVLFAAGLLAGLSPLVWLGLYEQRAHTWLDPLVRRVHSFIVEFQSPFSNGLWSQAESLQAFALAVAALALLPWRRASWSGFAAALVIGLCLLSLVQTRWLGLMTVAATLVLCLSYRKHPSFLLAALVLSSAFAGSWLWKWKQMETNPGNIFLTDLALQVAARDINLSLQSHSQGSEIRVAMPYAFAATSALFEEVSPLGTFYWENRAGLAESAAIFASHDDTAALEQLRRNQVEYLVVQGGRQGAPFANLTTWVHHETRSPETISKSLAWRLSSGTNIPAWCQEVSFHGTFDPNMFNARIYRIVD